VNYDLTQVDLNSSLLLLAALRGVALQLLVT